MRAISTGISQHCAVLPVLQRIFTSFSAVELVRQQTDPGSDDFGDPCARPFHAWAWHQSAAGDPINRSLNRAAGIGQVRRLVITNGLSAALDARV